MFSDILQRFCYFGAIFSIYSVEMATSKYIKFRHASSVSAHSHSQGVT